MFSPMAVGDPTDDLFVERIEGLAMAGSVHISAV